MALTPSSTIVAAQSGNNRFDFVNFKIALSDGRAQTLGGIFLNGSDEYQVLANIPDFSDDPDHLTPRISVFKRSGITWSEQDAANRPHLKNWDTILNPATPIASDWGVAHVGTKLYIFYFNDVAVPVLARMVFDMATDSYGAEALSTLTFNPGSSPAADYSTSFSSQMMPHMSVVYSDVTEKISILGSHWTNTTFWARPCIAQYDPTGDTFDATWTPMGHDSTVHRHEGIFSACVDCRGAVDIIFVQFSFAGPGTTTLFFQSYYSDATLSLPQDMGIPVTGFADETDSRLLCTGADFILPYGTGQNPNNFRTAILNARAAVPSTNVLPSAWTSESVHIEATDEYTRCYVAFYVGTELLIVYTKVNTNTPTTTLACAIWNGVTWDDNAVPSATLVLATPNGPNANQFGIEPLITYDFTGTVIVGNTLGDTIGVSQRIFSYESTRIPTCAVVVDITLTFDLVGARESGGGALVAVNPDSPAPGPILTPTECINQQ